MTLTRDLKRKHAVLRLGLPGRHLCEGRTSTVLTDSTSSTTTRPPSYSTSGFVPVRDKRPGHVTVNEVTGDEWTAYHSRDSTWFTGIASRLSQQVEGLHSYSHRGLQTIRSISRWTCHRPRAIDYTRVRESIVEQVQALQYSPHFSSSKKQTTMWAAGGSPALHIHGRVCMKRSGEESKFRLKRGYWKAIAKSSSTPREGASVTFSGFDSHLPVFHIPTLPLKVEVRVVVESECA